MASKKAIIIGAGPAGLTAAHELAARTGIQPIILEASDTVGGLSRTANYKGNRIDIGGHRFFSKSDWVMQWWQNFLPVQGASEQADPVTLTYQGRTTSLDLPAKGPDPDKTDRVMLLRRRLSRILYLRKFFDYPITFKLETVLNLGIIRIFKIGFSYLRSLFFPIRTERSLEDFFINRFGRELYVTFFKDYTEKVWGVPCTGIKPEWGSQRVKGLSIGKALANGIAKIFRRRASLEQKKIETSLIERFLYPKFGPGQLWEEVARRVVEKGGAVHLRQTVSGIRHDQQRITGIEVKDEETGAVSVVTGDYFFSTMPVKDLVESMTPEPPAEVREVAAGLAYRDFITVGLLLKKMKARPDEMTVDKKTNLIPDNWIYVQESDVRVGRIQVFNNWSPWLLKDPNTVWLGLEYFCNEGDDLWSQSDEQLARLAAAELAKIGMADEADVLDGVVIRMKKTYPAYFGTYDKFQVIRDYTDQFENLFLIGRNGMHRYNNQDHSMLTALTAVNNIINGVKTKDNIWSVNTEQSYHEEKEDDAAHER